MRHKTIVISIEFIIIIYLPTENNYYIFDLAITAQIQKVAMTMSNNKVYVKCM